MNDEEQDYTQDNAEAMAARQAEERRIAAEQDAALQAVRAACDAERARAAEASKSASDVYA